MLNTAPQSSTPNNTVLRKGENGNRYATLTFPRYQLSVFYLSVYLLIWSGFALLWHTEPFHSGLLIELTILSWNATLYDIAILLWLIVFVVWTIVLTAAESEAGRICSTFFYSPGGNFGIMTLSLLTTLFALIWVPLLNLNGFQDRVNGRLHMCLTHCKNPFESCEHQPRPLFDTRLKNDIADEAVSFFRHSIFGEAPPVVANLASNNLAVVWGDTAAEECVVDLKMQAGVYESEQVLLVVGNAFDEGKAIGDAYNYSVLTVFDTPSSACFSKAYSGGEIATQAALINAVALALAPRKLNLYGCSIHGKIANWAAATASEFNVAYETIFIDSGGTAGLASVREVGACGEPFRALVYRHGKWLAANASNSRKISSWPNVDVGDLMLSVCSAGTKYVVSSSSGDSWNNAHGLKVSVDAAREHGCDIKFINPEGTQHCGLMT